LRLKKKKVKKSGMESRLSTKVARKTKEVQYE